MKILSVDVDAYISYMSVKCLYHVYMLLILKSKVNSRDHLYRKTLYINCNSDVFTTFGKFVLDKKCSVFITFFLLLFQEQVSMTVRELLSVCLKSSPKVASPILDLFRLVFSRKRSQEQEQADNELCMEQLQGMSSNAQILFWYHPLCFNRKLQTLGSR